MTTPPAQDGALLLGHLFDAAGLDVEELIVLRHTYTPDGLTSPGDVTPEKVRSYVRRQDVGNKLSPDPSRL